MAFRSGGNPSARPALPSALRHTKVGVPRSSIIVAAAMLVCSRVPAAASGGRGSYELAAVDGPGYTLLDARETIRSVARDVAAASSHWPPC